MYAIRSHLMQRRYVVGDGKTNTDNGKKEKKIKDFFKKGGHPADAEWAALIAPGTGTAVSCF